MDRQSGPDVFMFRELGPLIVKFIGFMVIMESYYYF